MLEAKKKIDSTVYALLRRTPKSTKRLAHISQSTGRKKLLLAACFTVLILMSAFYWLPALAIDRDNPTVIGHPFNPDGYYQSVLWVGLGWFPVFIFYYWLPTGLSRFESKLSGVVSQDSLLDASSIKPWHFLLALAIGAPLILGFEFAIVADSKTHWFEKLGAVGWFAWFIPNFLAAFFAIAGFLHVAELLGIYKLAISKGVKVELFNDDGAGGLAFVGDMFLRFGAFAVAMGLWLVWFSAAVLVVPEFDSAFTVIPAFVAFVIVLWSLYVFLIWFLVLRPTRWTQEAMKRQLKSELATLTGQYDKAIKYSAADEQIDLDIDDALSRLESRIARVHSVFPINPYRSRGWTGIRLTAFIPLLLAVAPYAIRISQEGLDFELV